MTVEDLIKELKKCDPKMPVIFAESRNDGEEWNYEQVDILKSLRIVFNEPHRRFDKTWRRGRDPDDCEGFRLPDDEENAVECVLLTH